MSVEYELKTSAGCFGVIDFGGNGRECLLIHGTGHNAEAWRGCAKFLSREYHVIAFDLRGHGQTPENSSDCEQYWRDLGPIIDTLGLRDPILIGHSTGAYAATAFAASGGPCSACVCADGFVLDTLDRRLESREQKDNQFDRDALFEMFRYGWIATGSERDEYVQQEVIRSSTDWLNADVDTAILEKTILRCFLQTGEFLLRRPTIEEISVVSAPSHNSKIYPAIDLYEEIDIPMSLIWATEGLSRNRRDEVEAIASKRANRTFHSIESSHNVPMQRPRQLADIILHDLRLLEGATRVAQSPSAK